MNQQSCEGGAVIFMPILQQGASVSCPGATLLLITEQGFESGPAASSLCSGLYTVPPPQGSSGVSGRDFSSQSNILYRGSHGSIPESRQCSLNTSNDGLLVTLPGGQTHLPGV